MAFNFLNAQLVTNKTALVAFFVGPNADESETLSDTQLKDIGNNLIVSSVLVPFPLIRCLSEIEVFIKAP